MRTIAEVFPPGDFVKEEMEERGWTRTDLMEALGSYAPFVDDILAGDQPITLEIAKKLGIAFGTGAELWLNLENAYRNSQ